MDETKAGQEAGTPRTPIGFTVRIWCRDCYGEDPLGCYDGGSEYIEEPNAPYAPLVFATREEAEAAGDDAIDGTINEYAVEPVSGEPPARPPTPDGSASMAGKEK